MSRLESFLNENQNIDDILDSSTTKKITDSIFQYLNLKNYKNFNLNKREIRQRLKEILISIIQSNIKKLKNGEFEDKENFRKAIQLSFKSWIRGMDVEDKDLAKKQLKEDLKEIFSEDKKIIANIIESIMNSDMIQKMFTFDTQTKLKNIAKFVTSKYPSFDSDIENNILMLSTKEHGDVGEEEAGEEDIKMARKIKREIEKEFVVSKIKIETIDEFTQVNVKV